MNWDQIVLDWAQRKASAKQRWSKLSEEQLSAIAGRRVYLVARIQETYQVSREEAEGQIAAWQALLQSTAQGKPPP
jgi:uncharacterized protein YjbJ (UPF0337 family)